MERLIDYRRWQRTANAIATVMTLLAIAFAAPAGAETTEAPSEPTGMSAAEVATPTSAAPALPPVEEAAPPAEDLPPEPEEAPKAPIEETVAASGAPEPADAGESSEVSSTAAVPAKSSPTPSVAVARTAEAIRQAPATAASQVVDRAGRSDALQAPIETANSALSNALPDGFTAALSNAAAPAQEVLDLVTPPPLEELLPSLVPSFADSVLASASAPLGGGQMVVPSKAPSFTPAEMAGSIATQDRGATMEGSSLSKYLGAFGGIEPPPLGGLSAPPAAAGSHLLAILRGTDGVHFGSGAGGFSHNPPANHPSPPINAPGAVPGSGGSFFVPLAALLALLALAALATFRRRREAPAFRAPTPFVCALERPG